MGKRRRRRAADASEPVPELKGVVRLLSETPVVSCDLHGHTTAQARSRLRAFLTTQSRVSSGRVVHVITGRGNRSEGEPVLPGLLREALSGELAEHVEDYAALPGGGAFAIRLR